MDHLPTQIVQSTCDFHLEKHNIIFQGSHAYDTLHYMQLLNQSILSPTREHRNRSLHIECKGDDNNNNNNTLAIQLFHDRYNRRLDLNVDLSLTLKYLVSNISYSLCEPAWDFLLTPLIIITLPIILTDRYEREADTIAERVMRMSAPSDPDAPMTAARARYRVDRKCEACEMEAE